MDSRKTSLTTEVENGVDKTNLRQVCEKEVEQLVSMCQFEEELFMQDFMKRVVLELLFMDLDQLVRLRYFAMYFIIFNTPQKDDDEKIALAKCIGERLTKYFEEQRNNSGIRIMTIKALQIVHIRHIRYYQAKRDTSV